MNAAALRDMLESAMLRGMYLSCHHTSNTMLACRSTGTTLTFFDVLEHNLRYQNCRIPFPTGSTSAQARPRRPWVLSVSWRTQEACVGPAPDPK